MNKVIIANEFDEEGNELESYEVVFKGECSEVMEMSHAYPESIQDAFELAEDARDSAGAEIVWECSKPAWAV
jgi:hypothetical protein